MGRDGNDAQSRSSRFPNPLARALGSLLPKFKAKTSQR